MSFAVKISLAAAGFYLLTGMLVGVIKYRQTMQSADHRAPIYIDIAHRASLFYSFAALVISHLLEHNAFSQAVLLPSTLAVLMFFSLTILGYFLTGMKNETDNLFSERNFVTTWFMYALIAGEIGGFVIIFAGFLVRTFAL